MFFFFASRIASVIGETKRCADIQLQTYASLALDTLCTCFPASVSEWGPAHVSEIGAVIGRFQYAKNTTKSMSNLFG